MLISHRAQLDALKPSPIRTHITARFNQLSEETDIPPIIILIESLSDIKNSNLEFLGSRGLLSDLNELHSPKEPGFIRVFDWVSFIPGPNLFECLYLEADLGYWIMILEDTALALPELLWVLTSEELGGLSTPQPLY